MLHQIQGIHHVTSIASSPVINHRFFTQILGLRLVKKTVNFDNPQVYHFYYGDRLGTPGTLLTYFPFPHKAPGSRGTGEVGTVAFSIPPQSVEYWQDRLKSNNIQGNLDRMFGYESILFAGPDGESLRLIATDVVNPAPWVHGDIPGEFAISGLHSAVLAVENPDHCMALLNFMGYEQSGAQGPCLLFKKTEGNQARHLAVCSSLNGTESHQGAGSVHHIAFAVKDRAAQLEVRNALIERGYNVTEVRDRNYFWAIYFRTEDGILFEIATNEPGFTIDEDADSLGQALRLPPQHEHLRTDLFKSLPEIGG